jgi:hypothetical protein
MSGPAARTLAADERVRDRVPTLHFSLLAAQRREPLSALRT